MRYHWLIASIFISILVAQAQSPSCDTPSELARLTYYSATVSQHMVYTVYTPPCYDPNRSASYPVIYLLHGSNEDDRQWTRLGLPALLDEEIASGRMPPLIVVMPFGNNIANNNRFDHFSWRHIFVNELLPDAESRYHISTTPTMRAIGGISRGGFWAYQIAFTHPDLFGIVGGHSAFFDRYHAQPDDNPLDLALTAPNLESMRLWLDRGIDDFAYEGLDLMAERLTERNLTFDYAIHPIGEHNNRYWSSHLADYLAFYTATWQPSVMTTAMPTQTNLFVTNTPPATVAPSPLLLPVVAFPSLQTSITHAELQTIADGDFHERLILTAQQADAIHAHSAIQRVTAANLYDTLWRTRDAFTLLPLAELTPQYRVLLVDDMPLLDQLALYPFAGNHENLTRVTISGVTALTRNTRTALDEQGIDWATEALAPYVRSSDFFHISNEVSFIENCPQAQGDRLGGATSFCSTPAHFDLFTALDVDIVELTGNHNNDYGYQAYRDTLAWYQDHAIMTLGGGETVNQAQTPLIIHHNGNHIAWLACNNVGPYYALVNEDQTALGGVRPGATPCDWTWLEATLPDLAQTADLVIVSVQYQEVEDYQPLPSQQNDFRRLANLGADVVIGSQAHKPQTVEFFPTQRGQTAFIHYGLGNLYFDQPFWGNRRFFLDTLYIADGQLRAVELFPGIIDELARPRLMTSDERQNFMFFMLSEQNGW